MGVYIKGMEMPTDCIFCPMFRGAWTMCSVLNKTTGVRGRPDDCPLVPVPDHGRLIDERWLKDAMITTLEALKKNPKMDRQEMHLIAAFDTLRCMVEDAPTIIEAEEGE